MSFISDIWDDYGGGLLTFLLNLLKAVAVAVIGNWLINKATAFLGRMLSRNKNIEPTIIKFAVSAVALALKFMLVIIVAGLIGIQTSQFVALFGAAVFALAFALQGTLGDMAAGVLLLTFRPFKVGDYVIVTDGDTQGHVRSIEMFATHVIDPSGHHIIVPNSDITSAQITNWHLDGQIRLECQFFIGFNTRLKELRQEILDVVWKERRVLRDPPAAVVVTELEDDSCTMELRAWVDPDDYFDVRPLLLEKLREILARHKEDEGEGEEAEEAEEEAADDEGASKQAAAALPEVMDVATADVPRCQQCQKEASAMYCVDCKRDYCISCSMRTHGQPATREHFRLPMKKKADFLKHPAKYLKQAEKRKERAAEIARAAATHVTGLAEDSDEEARGKGGDLNARREMERSRVQAVANSNLNNQNTREVHYIISNHWLGAWKKFIAGGALPGPVDNKALLQVDGRTPRPNLKIGVDYRALSKEQWELFVSMYGGGPEIKRRQPIIYD